jgi:hypothetical protein
LVQLSDVSLDDPLIDTERCIQSLIVKSRRRFRSDSRYASRSLSNAAVVSVTTPARMAF